MRFSILLIALALLPMMMVVHGWIFTEKQLPHLQQQALKILQKNGIQSAVADLRYLDLRIAGDARDLESLEKVRAEIAATGPLRLVADELAIPAKLRARQVDSVLHLEGWLPDESNLGEVKQLLGKLRPDLTLDMDDLRTDAKVRWPEGEKGPLTVDSSLMGGLVEKLRVAPWLEIKREAGRLQVSGILPAGGLRSSLLADFDLNDAEDLLESTHTEAVSFADPEVLLPFLERFFAGTSSRRFFINEKEGPLLEAPATRSQESEWLALLRPVSGGKRVTLKLTFYPSEFHFPDQRTTTPLPDDQLKSLRQALTGQLIRFPLGSSSLSPVEQAQLAALTPILLTAGPALRLVIGGHPDPEGDPARERTLAKTRAEQVHSFLVEQGLPTSDVKIVSFDSVPAGTLGAPAQPRSVEILLR